MRAEVEHIAGPSLRGTVLHWTDSLSRHAPVVIDFVPYWGPREYAGAIFVVDAMLWEAAPMDLVHTAGLDHMFWQLLVRAALWRLLVLDVQYQRGHVSERELTQVTEYRWFASWLETVKR